MMHSTQKLTHHHINLWRPWRGAFYPQRQPWGDKCLFYIVNSTLGCLVWLSHYKRHFHFSFVWFANNSPMNLFHCVCKANLWFDATYRDCCFTVVVIVIVSDKEGISSKIRNDDQNEVVAPRRIIKVTTHSIIMSPPCLNSEFTNQHLEMQQPRQRWWMCLIELQFSGNWDEILRIYYGLAFPY